MPIFELEGPDGKSFEVDAPDVTSAVSAFKKFSAPVEPRLPPARPTDLPASPSDAPADPAAVGMGIVSGLPVVGPYVKGGLSNLAAGVRALKDGTSFADAKAQVEAINQGLATNNPGSTMAGEIAGGIVGTAPLVAAAPFAFGAGAASLPVRALTSAATGSAMGGADAFTRGQDPGTGAALGFGLGLAAPLAAAGIGKVAGSVASKFNPVSVPTVPELKAASQVAYLAADNEGVRIAQPTFQNIVGDINAAVRDAGIDKTLHPRATAVLSRFEEAAGSSPMLSEAETLRRVAKGATNSLEPDEKRIGKIILDKLDAGIGRLGQADVVSSGDPQVAVEALKSARELWARSRKAEMIGDALTRGEQRAAQSGSGGNANNAMRQEIGRILMSPKKARGFDEAERGLMDEIVRGGKVDNGLRTVGKLSPTTGGLTSVGMQLAAAINPLAIIPNAVGTGAKIAADGVTKARMNRLAQMVANGGPVETPAAVTAAEERARQIAQILMAADPVVANRTR